ncbi:uncharacterized protein PSFLO_03401 [Pseudozyma flocculosa]|uniref:Beta-mannosidase Ig-fold domain-containing protein n=1 Tax=Pseudozyma flocculosa TaxID=84751 RepID=A0A5C3F085_9BASI|nr:uncharacterized protein PSFLO_03401 [Pseudozyma flocculosa]
MMHYASARTQDRIVAAPLYDSDTERLQVYILSDFTDVAGGGRIGVDVGWTWYDFDGHALSSPRHEVVTMSGLDARLVYDVSTRPSDAHFDAATRGGYLHVVVAFDLDGIPPPPPPGDDDQRPRRHRHRRANEHFLSPASLRHAPLRDPGLGITPIPPAPPDDGWRFDVHCAGPGVAAWVSVEHPDDVVGYFAEILAGATQEVPSIGFWMRPGETRRLRFQMASRSSPSSSSQRPPPAVPWWERVKVRSMWDSMAS